MAGAVMAGSVMIMACMIVTMIMMMVVVRVLGHGPTLWPSNPFAKHFNALF